MKIGVFNLGISNITSVTNVLDFIEADYNIISSFDDLKIYSQKYILPGVGNFKAGMESLNKFGFKDFIINNIYKKNIPILGICLGMQLFFQESEESLGIEGIGLIKGKVKKLRISNEYFTTRVGWEQCKVVKDFLGFKENENFDAYFVHSFECLPNDNNIITATSSSNKIVSAINYNDLIFGCQFHPEKSSKDGIKIIENFVKKTL